jgi:hypothetical protein
VSHLAFPRNRLEKSHVKASISATWGDSAAGATRMELGMSCDSDDVSNPAEFCFD